MSFHDLTGQKYTYLKVLKRSPDHVTKSGQKKVMWNCECILCGNIKDISAQSLKNGRTKSCGCYQSYAGKLNRNKRRCIICGKEFETPPSNNKVTCLKKCQVEYARQRRTGRALSAETKNKISTKAKGRDMAELQVIAVKAAKASPKSGRFETNINAIDWHLISPDGKHYYLHSLLFWLRENCTALFGCEADSREMYNVYSGLAGAKRAMLGKKYNSATYKGWKVIPTIDDSVPTKAEKE